MIALVDCNNFYVSCERVFNPALRNRPVIVLSNNDGCAISRSEEAKALGIGMAAPAFLMQDLLKQHKVAVLSSNYTLYGDMSGRIMKILADFAPSVEVYSIDEAFLDLSHVSPQHLPTMAGRIRETVLQYTGIPVGVGIAPTKTLAKLANRYAKNSTGKICFIDSGDKITEVLRSSSVADIWGIGKQYQDLLTSNGIHTALDLVNTPEEWVRKKLSVVGQRMVHELSGRSTLTWEPQPEKKKNMCTSRSFRDYLSNLDDIEQALANHVATCARKLRQEGSCARSINVFIHTNPFSKHPQHYPSIDIDLPVATNATNELLRYALKALRVVFKPGILYQKAGVIARDLVPETEIQTSLFDRQDRPRDKALNATLDAVNAVFGKDKVRFGVQGYGNNWRLKADMLSGRYTTQLTEIMIVKS